MFDNSPFNMVKLGDVVADKETRDPRKTPNRQFKYIDISSVSSVRYVICEPKNIRGSDAPSRARKVVRVNDIIFATTRPYLKSVAIIPESLDGQICSTGFCVLRPTTKIDHEWIFFCSISDQFMSQIIPLMRGANYPAVTDKDLFGVQIPLPPIKKQRQIIARIKECFDRVEEIKELRDENIKMANVLYRSRLQDAYDEMLLESPLCEFAQIVRDTKLGLVRSKQDQSPNCTYHYVKMQDINNTGHLNMSNLVKVDATDREVEVNSLKKGDFLFNTRNSYELVGKTAIVPILKNTTLFNNNILRVRFKENILSSFINHLFQHKFVQTQLDLRKNKTTSVCAIYWKMLATVKIPIPKLEVQHDFVREMDCFSGLQMAIAREMRSCNDISIKLRESILRKAFAGEL